MLLSMTGYGTGSAQQNDTTVTVEIRTVNHRFLDLHVRVPREFLFLETEIQQLVRSALRRGRVDASVMVQGTQAGGYAIDSNAARSYMESAAILRDQFQIEGTLDVSTLLTLPGVVQSKDSLHEPEEGDASALCDLARKAGQDAVGEVIRMREREGAALSADLRKHLAHIRERVSTIQTLSPSVVQENSKKLQDRLAQLLPQNGMDPQRLAQEVALLADRSDISEELARLGSHLDQFTNMIEAGKEIGKRLDFLLQEMQREVNTILSKSGNLEIARCGIDIKADIEKVREQVQNVE